MSEKDYVVIDGDSTTSKDIDGDELSVSENITEEPADDVSESISSLDGQAEDDEEDDEVATEDSSFVADNPDTTDVDESATSNEQPDEEALDESIDDAGENAQFTYLEHFTKSLKSEISKDTETDAEEEPKTVATEEASADTIETTTNEVIETAEDQVEAVASDVSEDISQGSVADAPEEDPVNEMKTDTGSNLVTDTKSTVTDGISDDVSASSTSSSGGTDKVPGFIKIPIAIGIAAVCALGGFALGHISGNPMAGAPASVKTELTNEELSTVVGRVSFDGQTVDITAKDAIMLNDTLNGDSHSYPTADMVVATARNLIMQKDAEKRGIQATDEDLKQFAQGMLGSDDYETIANEYNIDTESLQALVKSSYISQEVRKQVVGDNEPELASPPAAPAEGESATAKSEYYTYIIDAAGDEWDAEKQAWVDEDGEFAQMLKSSKTFDPKAKTATYDDALGAYQVLGSRYSAEASTYDTLWSDYMKELFSQANITIYSLMA